MKHVRTAVDEFTRQVAAATNETEKEQGIKMSSTASSFAPVAPLTGSPIRLAMQRLWLTGQVLPAGARLVVQHVFQSDKERALEVIYSLPLPRDAALRGFRITGDGFETIRN